MPRTSKPRVEAEVRAAIRSHLQDLFPGSYVESNSPGPWGASGRPDFELCVPGIHLPDGHHYNGLYTGLELKREDYEEEPWKGLDEEQQIKLEEITAAFGLSLLTNKVPYRTSDNHWALDAWMWESASAWVPVTIKGFVYETLVTQR